MPMKSELYNNLHEDMVKTGTYVGSMLIVITIDHLAHLCLSDKIV